MIRKEFHPFNLPGHSKEASSEEWPPFRRPSMLIERARPARIHPRNQTRVELQPSFPL